MHQEAYDGFARMLAQTELTASGSYLALDVGGADINGSVRAQLPNTTWHGIDIEVAPGVDIVADASKVKWLVNHSWRYDIVIATELFEHTPDWSDIIYVMSAALSTEGPQVFIATCASDGRPPHGARGEWGVPDDQWYANVSPSDLESELKKWFKEVHVEFNPHPGDAYMWARGV